MRFDLNSMFPRLLGELHRLYDPNLGSEEYQHFRPKFVTQAWRIGVPFKDIAYMLDISEGRARQLKIYGHTRVLRSLRNEVKKRDGNKCVSCGSNGTLQVHHIRSSKSHVRRNLITLCLPCHREADRLRREHYKKIGGSNKKKQ